MMLRFEPSLVEDVLSFTPRFERSFPPGLTHFAFHNPIANYPYVNVAEYKDSVEVVAEVPGVSKENIKVQLENGTLTISGERKSPEENKESEWLRNEIRYGSFSRMIELPESIDASKVSAEYVNGVLRITLPKQEVAKPKEISIR